MATPSFPSHCSPSRTMTGHREISSSSSNSAPEIWSPWDQWWPSCGSRPRMTPMKKTRKSLEIAQKQGKMNCVKEVTSSANPFVRQRPSHGKMSTPVVPPPKKKEVVAELSSSNKFGSNNSTSPHRLQSGGTPGNPPPSGKPPPPPPPNANGRNNNPELVRKPLRERIIHLLAVKAYKKVELINKLFRDGIKEKDRRQLTSVLMSVSQVKDNLHHLSRHLWSEVKEDWSFYTDKEKEMVKRMKPQLSPSRSDNGHCLTSTLPLSLSPRSHGVKRPHEETLDPTAKRQRGGRWNMASARRKNASFPADDEVKPEPPPDTRTSSKQKSTTPGPSPEHRLEAKNGRHNNHHRNHRDNSHGALTNGTAAATTTTTSTTTITTSPARKPSSTSPLNHGSSPRNHHHPPHINGLHHNHSSGNHSPINGVTNGLTNGHANHLPKTNGHATPPSSSPDSHYGGEDSPPMYLRNYTNIVSADQRSRYKADFNKQYQEYLKLHSFIEERARPFTNLDEQLRNETLGSDKYNTIRAQILRAYEATQQDHNFQGKKKRYNYLHEKLTHIKRLVREYDATTHS